MNLVYSSGHCSSDLKDHEASQKSDYETKQQLFTNIKLVQNPSGSNWRCKLFLGAVWSGRWEGISCVGTMDNSWLSITYNDATKDIVFLIDGKGKNTPLDTIPCIYWPILPFSGVFILEATCGDVTFIFGS